MICRIIMWKAIYIYICTYVFFNYSLDISSTFWVSYLEENSLINAVNLILFSFLLAKTQLFSASLYQLYKSSDIQSGTSSCHLAGSSTTLQAACIRRIFFLAAMGIGWLVLTILAEWLANVYPCLPQLPNPLEFMAQSTGLLWGIIVLARGENTWRWNCLSVKVFRSTLEVPVPSPELGRRQEWWRGDHQEWERKTTTLVRDRK